MIKLFKLTLLGIAWGCTMFTLTSLIFVLTMGESFFNISPSHYITQVFCAMICGIGFTIPSLAYDKQTLSLPLQVTIHMGTGLCIYFICAVIAGWIPVQLGILPVLMIILCMLAISFIIWFCFYLYYRYEAKQMNQKIKEIRH